MVVGGPTTVLDLGGLRIVSDPTFDAPGAHGYLTKTAGPAVHGPEDAERDADGFVNCEVIGFVLSGQGVPTVYISGDNASVGTVAEIAERVPAIDAVVLHAGAARVPGKFRDRALSLDSIRAAAAAAILGSAMVIPAHYDGWAHFSEGRDDLVRAFDDAGLSARLRLGDHGTWVSLKS
jgi:L-ascorbate metabolism protein UlaG (beta-lactamase superfamily)